MTGKKVFMETFFKLPMSIDCVAWHFPIQEKPFACAGHALKSDAVAGEFSTFYAKYEEAVRSGQKISFEIDNDHLRSIGFQRPRSATRSAKIAAGLFHHLLSNKYCCSRRSAVFTLSLTAVAGMAFDYEKFGMESGWDLADPFWLPNSINTSISTHLARLGDQVKMAWAFAGDPESFFFAIEHAYYCLLRRTVEEVVVICSEQINPFQSEVYSGSGGIGLLMEGATALVFSLPSASSPGQWCVQGLLSGTGPLPAPPHVCVELSEPFNFLDTLSFPVILARELAQREGGFTFACVDRENRYQAIQLMT